MNDQLSYEQIKENLLYELNVAKECVDLNSYLNQFNWVFLQPIMWVKDFKRLKKITTVDNVSNDDILEVMRD